VTLFQAFFQSFGALVVFFALVSWRSVVNGQANRSQVGCVVQFVFGIMLINVLAITNALVAMFA
jgi:tetrahydromethanopterin S-methyltransferase subunit E